MKKFVSCWACEGTGFVHSPIEITISKVSCSQCKGLGKSLEYFGEFAKEERREDEIERREKLKEEYDRQQDYFEFKHYRGRDPI
jgi:DnaJ-class molecular chaperone